MIRGTFEQLINTGIQQLELIADAKDKANICAQLALAIAESGLLEDDSKPKKTSVQKPKATADKKDLEKTAGKGIKEEPVKEEPVKEEPKTKPTVAEWNDETLKQFEGELTFINQAVAAWGQDVVEKQLIGQFSEGTFTGLSNITPLNIQAFVIFLNRIIAERQ